MKETNHTSDAAFTERRTIGLSGLRIHAVHHLDRVLELLPLDLVLQLDRKSGQELDPAPF